MPFELIRRKEGETSQKQEIRHKNVQISINDWGHLVIREFDESKYNYGCGIVGEACPKGTGLCRDLASNYQCEHYKITREDDEHLIVFDRATTERIINFIFSVRSTYELKKLLKDLIDNKDSLPF